MQTDLVVFGLGDSNPYAKQLAEQYLNIALAEHEENYFDDGECYVRSKENVRGKDVFVICSLCNTQHERLADKVVKLLFFTGSLRDASARRITLVFPYMAYQRQDRKNKSRAPIYTKYFPMILESVRQHGDRILVLDPHNLSAFQSGNRYVNDHVEAKGLIAEAIAKQIQKKKIDNLVVLSPDEGGVKRARFFRDTLAKEMSWNLDIAYVDKIHENNGHIEANEIIGDVSGKHVVIYDDMISSGKTMVEAANAVEAAGGCVYAVCATHALCVGSAQEHLRTLMEKSIEIFTTDSVLPFGGEIESTADIIEHMHIIPTWALIGEAILRIHQDDSVSSLIGDCFSTSCGVKKVI